MQKILLAIDGSESCNKAIDKVVELTKGINTEINVITVIEERILIQEPISRSHIENEVEKKRN